MAQLAIVEKEIELEEGEVICSKCEGRGSITWGGSYLNYTSCPKCHGTKKLDWVTDIMGINYSTTTSSSGGVISSSSISAPTEKAIREYVSQKTNKKENLNGKSSEFRHRAIQRFSGVYHKSKRYLHGHRHS